MIDALSRWAFFNLPKRLVEQCRRKKGDDQKGCECGPKARCFEINLSGPARNSDETEVFVRKMLKDGKLGPLYTLMNDHLQKYLELYCEATKRRYGEHVLLCLKGGNVFTALVRAFLAAAEHTDTDAFDKAHEHIMKINDLDFEVFTDATFAHKFSEVVDVAKLSVMAMYDVRSSLLESNVFRDYSTARRKSDNIVVPVEKRLGDCDTCNTLYMPVPSVLRSTVGRRWYRPDDTRCNTILPISYNTTLKRLFGADVMLLRMKVSLPESKESAEVYDIAVPLHRDPIHKVVLSQHRRRWFTRSACGRHVCSIHYMYYSLRHTMFMEDIAPWDIFKVDKKTARMAYCIAIACAVDGSTGLADVRRWCKEISTALLTSGAALPDAPYPFDEFSQDMVNACKKFGDKPQFRRQMSDNFLDVDSELAKCRLPGVVSVASFESHLNVLNVLSTSEGKTARGN